MTAATAAVPLLRLASRQTARRATQWTAAAALGLHFTGLVAYTAQQQALPLTGLAPALSSLAFLSGLLAAGLLWLTAEAAILLLAMPLIVGPLAISLVAGFDQVPAAATAGRGGWFLLHTGLSLLGLALLGVACTAAALYLLQHRALKKRRFGVIFQFAPPLEQLDRLNHLALIIGFPSLTLGILLAITTALGGAEAVHLSPTHVGWGGASWLLAGVLAALRWTHRLRGRRAAIASLGAFGIVVVAYVVLLLTGGGEARFL